MSIVSAAQKTEMLAHVTSIVEDRPYTITIIRKQSTGSTDIVGHPVLSETTIVSGVTGSIIPATNTGENKYQRAGGGEQVLATNILILPFSAVDTPYTILAGDIIQEGGNEYEVLFSEKLTPGQHHEVQLFRLK